MGNTINISLGIIGVLLVSGLGLFVLTPDQLNKASTCTTTNTTGIFERFSTTNVTAYWTINGTTKSSVCTKGKWIPTTEWLKINNLTSKDITYNTVIESNITENGIEVITVGSQIIVDKTKQISIGGVIYNITYTDKPAIIKCVCDKIEGCKLKECLI